MNFQDEKKSTEHFFNKDGECDSKDALCKTVFFTDKRKSPHYYIRTYDHGANAGCPVNPNLNISIDPKLTTSWKRVGSTDYQSYLDFVKNGGNYDRLLRQFLSSNYA